MAYSHGWSESTLKMIPVNVRLKSSILIVKRAHLEHNNPGMTCMKVLPNSFDLNGQTLGFHQQTQKLQPPCAAQ